MNNYLLIACGVLTLANILVSFQCILSDLFGPGQKLFQCLIVWLVPIFGAVGIYAFSRSFKDPIKPSYKSFGGGATKNLWGTSRRW
jgi:hypothetical protein